MDILITVGYIVACVLLFSLAIAIHEFGHFIVALKLGLRVERFSIGFGPALWKKTYKGVEYRISAIPLGGYVAIPDLDPEGTKALEGGGEKKEGERSGEGQGERSRSGEGQGERSRSREGQGERSRSGEGQGERSRSREGQGERSRSTKDVKVHIAPWKQILVAFAGPAMNLVLAVVLAVLLSLIPSARFGELPTVIGGVFPNGAAEKAGIKVGDRIVSVGGHPVSTWTEMQTEVQISGGKPTEFVVERACSSSTDCQLPTADCQLHNLTVTPEKNETTGAYLIMAYSVTNAAGAVAWMPARSPLKQLAWDAGSIFRVLKGLVTPKEAKATAGALGGPVMIAEGIYRSLRRDAWDGVGFMRFLNVNLAILNLLPIPVLDGGLIFFALLAILIRRPVPEKVVTTLSMAFMYLLLGLMGVLILKDSWRSWKIHTYKPETRCSSSSSCSSETNETTNATSQSR